MTNPETPQPKKRNTKSWKTLAHQNQQDANYWRAEVARSEKEVAGLNSILADVRAVSETWKNTAKYAEQRFVITAGVAVGELLGFAYLFWRYVLHAS